CVTGTGRLDGEATPATIAAEPGVGACAPIAAVAAGGNGTMNEAVLYGEGAGVENAGYRIATVATGRAIAAVAAKSTLAAVPAMAAVEPAAAAAAIAAGTACPALPAATAVSTDGGDAAKLDMVESQCSIILDAAESRLTLRRRHAVAAVPAA